MLPKKRAIQRERTHVILHERPVISCSHQGFSAAVTFSSAQPKHECYGQNRCRGGRGGRERYLFRRRERWRWVTTARAKEDTCQWPGLVWTDQNSCFVWVTHWQRRESETLCAFILRRLDTDETLGFKLHLKVAFLLHSIVLQAIAQTDSNVAHCDTRSVTTLLLRC